MAYRTWLDYWTRLDNLLAYEEDGHEGQGHRLQPQPPAIFPDKVVEYVRHDQDPCPLAADHRDLHQLPPLLEILAKHEHEAVLGH